MEGGGHRKWHRKCHSLEKNQDRLHMLTLCTVNMADKGRQEDSGYYAFILYYKQNNNWKLRDVS